MKSLSFADDIRWYDLLWPLVPRSLAYVVDTEEPFHIDFPMDTIKQGIEESSCSWEGHGSHFQDMPWTLVQFLWFWFLIIL